jgi:hypothetical protein
MKEIKSSKSSSPNATLIIDGKEVTSNISHHLRKAAYSKEIKDLLNKYNKWKGDTIDNIWWKIHGPCIDETIGKEKIFIQKFIHGTLPCNYRNNKKYPYKSKYCTMCNDQQTVEDQMHVLKCKKCPERVSRRDQFQKDLQRLLITLGTQETTTRVITQYIGDYLQEKSFKDIKTITPDASIHLRNTLIEQNKIGWENFLKGRICIEWGELYKHDILINDKLNLTSHDAEQWGKKLVQLMWRFVIDMWTIRNNKEDTNEGISNEVVLRKEIEQMTWLLQNIKVTHPYENITQENMMTIPILNLKIMNAQLQALYEVSKPK